MATSSLTDTVIVTDEESIKLIRKIMRTPGSHNDVEVDVFEEMRRCNELL